MGCSVHRPTCSTVTFICCGLGRTKQQNSNKIERQSECAQPRAQQSQRRYQSRVFALAGGQAANTPCEKQASKSHTDGEPCLSVAQSLC